MADDERKTHIFRVIGKTLDETGQVVDEPSAYLDIERSEYFKLVEGGGPDWKQTNVRLKWYMDDTGKVPNPSRETTTRKIIPPDEEDPDKPSVWFEVDTIDRIKIQDADQVIYHSFDNSAENMGRKVAVRRIVNYETTVDDDYPEGGVIPKEDYQKKASTKDKEQYLDFEFVQKRAFRDADQVYAISYNNQPLIDAAEMPDRSYSPGQINPPWRLDPLQNIVNVNFGSLAVEFSDESFIEIPQIVPPSKKMLWSIWFRAPAESLAAAKAEFEAWRDSGIDRAPLTGIVPIAVFGSPRTARKFDVAFREVGTIPAITNYIWDTSICGWRQNGPTTPAQPEQVAYYVFNDETRNIDPSYIGIDCSGDVPKLSVNIVMPSNNLASFEGAWPAIKTTDRPAAMGLYGTVTATAECTPPVNNHAPGDGSICDLEHKPSVLPFNDITNTDTYESNAEVVMGYRPETFRTVPAGNVGELSFGELMSSAALGGGQKVTPDEWHHLLLSIDLTNSCSTDGVLSDGTTFGTLNDTEGHRTSSACRMWISFDDVNLTKKALSSYWPSGYSDPNAILPVNGYYVADDVTVSMSRTIDDCWGNNITNVQVQQQPKFRYTPAAFAPGKVSFPAAAPFVDMSKRIEMGEAQVFTGVTVDSSQQNVRRAFITKDGSPAPLKKASDLLGKKPEILVHGSANWKKARNTGTLADPNNNLGGVVVGQIEKFKPNPKLGK
ncbi:hypothetical protein ACE10X_06995 [Bradyrhizobium sp. Pha-3]|uniref:hypothetical protein n=1 Tax=Bradyrhizobium sp. Pha-3 TaxID=208375 RepID=UPI0035D47B74